MFLNDSYNRGYLFPLAMRTRLLAYNLYFTGSVDVPNLLFISAKKSVVVITD